MSTDPRDRAQGYEIGRIGDQIVIISGGGERLEIFTPMMAVAMASDLAQAAAGTLPPEAVDLVRQLRQVSDRAQNTLAAWRPELHAGGPVTWHPDPYVEGPHTWPVVPAGVTKRCDNTSVGLIIRDQAGRYLMHRRVRPPAGIAPCAGHIDDHGSPEDAARAELAEEYGLTAVRLRPVLTGWHPGPCRRQHGPHGPGHDWTVFEAEVTGRLAPAYAEVEDLCWYTPDEVQQLAEHTVAVARGDAGAEQRDGLEPVWAEWLQQLNVVQVSPRDISAVAALGRRSPYPQPGDPAAYETARAEAKREKERADRAEADVAKLEHRPTQDAYEATCAALERHRARADAAEVGLAEARADLDGANELLVALYGRVQQLTAELASRRGPQEGAGPGLSVEAASTGAASSAAKGWAAQAAQTLGSGSPDSGSPDTGPAVSHTCNNGRGPYWGHLTAGCPRCDQLRDGAQRRELPGWRKRARRRRDDDAQRAAEIMAHFATDGPHARGDCGPVCTFGDW